jgi:hypothetical protein
MRTSRKGSAAAAVKATPESAANITSCSLVNADRAIIAQYLEALDLTLSHARSALGSAEPARAALLLVGLADDLRPELRQLRAIALRHLNTA